jgi:hypothetical protein
VACSGTALAFGSYLNFVALNPRVEWLWALRQRPFRIHITCKPVWFHVISNSLNQGQWTFPFQFLMRSLNPKPTYLYAVPWLRRLVAGPLPQRTWFALRSVRMVFVVDKVALVQIFLWVLPFFPCHDYFIIAVHTHITWGWIIGSCVPAVACWYTAWSVFKVGVTISNLCAQVTRSLLRYILYICTQLSCLLCLQGKWYEIFNSRNTALLKKLHFSAVHLVFF